MNDILERVENLKRTDIEVLLYGFYHPKSAEFKKAADTIMMRIECVGELLRNPSKLGALESRRVSWERESTPSGLTDEGVKEVIEDHDVGELEISQIKKETMPAVCHT